MKTDTFIKLLRKVIREEVQAVVREELGILLEAPDPKPVVAEAKQTTVKNSMVESIKPAKPTQPAKPMAFTQNNILNEILNQTAQSGDWRSVAEMNSNDAMGFGGIAEPTVVNSVDDTVPDFTGIMQTMNAKRQI